MQNPRWWTGAPTLGLDLAFDISAPLTPALKMVLRQDMASPTADRSGAIAGSDPQALVRIDAPWSMLYTAVRLGQLAYSDNFSSQLSSLGLVAFNDHRFMPGPNLDLLSPAAFAASDDLNKILYISFRGTYLQGF